jgi:hypothetical protein
MHIRAYEIFILMLISNVNQWEGDQDNGGVSDVVCIAGMVEGGGSMEASHCHHQWNRQCGHALY